MTGERSTDLLDAVIFLRHTSFLIQTPKIITASRSVVFDVNSIFYQGDLFDIRVNQVDKKISEKANEYSKSFLNGKKEKV